MLIYLNAKYIKVSPSQFNELLPGSLDGTGVFETMRMYKGRVFAFSAHMDRLNAGLRHFKLRSPLSRDKITSVIKQLSRRNGMINARVRVIVWCNSRLNISISLQKLHLPKAAIYRRGFRLMSALTAKKASLRSDVKSVDYKFFRSAFAKAAKLGFDEVIFFNSKGHLVEGSRTNIFFAKDGVLFTPSLRCGCLNGITRSSVIECAHKLGLKVKPIEASKSRFFGCDEAFLTGSTLEIMPIKSVDHKMIGKQRPGALTTKIRKQYAKMVKETLSI